MAQIVIALCAGLLFGFGLIVSAMVSPAKVLAFLDIAGPRFDPSLALVMAAAVTVFAIAAAIGRRRAKPLFAAVFSTPARFGFDRDLLLGSAVFGIGWGLAGYCPGPALVAAAFGAPTAFVFIAAMLAGMALANGLAARR